jgi:F-type H+-transporting ATPase subunit b
MDALGINLGNLIVQIVNFTIVMLVLRALVWGPLVRNLEARRERIAKGLEDARAAEQARANAERDAQRLIDERRAEASRFVDEGRSRGEEQAKAVLEEARREAESIRTRARQEAVEERNAVLGEVRQQVAQIAMAAAERVVGQTLSGDAAKSQAIISDFLSRASDQMRNLGSDITVTSALPLNAQEQAAIRQQTGAANVTFNVDPSILGGLVVRAGDRVIDGSVRANLNKLGAQMV